MTILWRGQGVVSPVNPHHVERLLGARICALGFNSTRNRKHGVFASTSRTQALEYAHWDQDHLFRIEPAVGATLVWMHDVADAIEDLSCYLRDLWINDIWRVRGWDCEALLRDSWGNVHTLDTYLELRRQKPRITAMIDSYLSKRTLKQHIVAKTDEDLSEVLEGHKGEVWIAGTYTLHSGLDAYARDVA